MDRQDRSGARVRLALLALAHFLTVSAAVAGGLPAGFVRLSDLAPDIAQDIRYARSFNFTAAPVPGYAAGECILTERTATALIAVEARLAADGYGLIVYDCTRPTRAVAHFVAWARADAAHDTGAGFFPGLTRADLFPMGFIAARSSHSLGVAVDVGLRRADDPVLRPYRMTAPCDAPFDQRPRESSLDMGTAFDCFSALSATDARVSPASAVHRARLTAAMQAEGFAGYRAEWWHFRNTADPAATPQDFVIR